MNSPRMRQWLLGGLFARLYSRLPGRRLWLRLIVRAEGGQLTSRTLRRVLRERFGVEAGAYAYGSLLEPGNADRLTTIHPFASIGPNVRRFGAAHPTDRVSMHPYWYNPALGMVGVDSDVERTSCEIGADSWIGANVTILPGCLRIGIGAVVGAASVVTKDVPDFAIVVGNPAHQIGMRFTEGQRAAILESRYWESEDLVEVRRRILEFEVPTE